MNYLLDKNTYISQYLIDIHAQYSILDLKRSIQALSYNWSFQTWLFVIYVIHNYKFIMILIVLRSISISPFIFWMESKPSSSPSISIATFYASLTFMLFAWSFPFVFIGFKAISSSFKPFESISIISISTTSLVFPIITWVLIALSFTCLIIDIFSSLIISSSIFISLQATSSFQPIVLHFSLASTFQGFLLISMHILIVLPPSIFIAVIVLLSQ